jgi:hypothetical protein
MQSMVAIVDSTWTANVGDLFVILSAVGILEGKEGQVPGAADVSQIHVNHVLDHFNEIDGGFTWIG